MTRRAFRASIVFAHGPRVSTGLRACLRASRHARARRPTGNLVIAVHDGMRLQLPRARPAEARARPGLP